MPTLASLHEMAKSVYLGRMMSGDGPPDSDDSGDEGSFETQVEEGAEPVLLYTRGLFYPICIGMCSTIDTE